MQQKLLPAAQVFGFVMPIAQNAGCSVSFLFVPTSFLPVHQALPPVLSVDVTSSPKD